MPTPQQDSRSIPLLVLSSLAAVYVVWGSTYLAIRFALDSVPPFLLAGGRFLAAGGILFGYLLARRTPLPTLSEWRDGAIVGVLLLVIGNGGVVLAEVRVPSGVAAMLIGATPLAATLWAGLWGVWPRRNQWFGIFLGLAGVVVLVMGTPLQTDPIATSYLVAAVAAWSLGSVLAQKRLKLAPGAMGFATEMIAGGAVLMTISVLSHEKLSGPVSHSAAVAWIYLVFVGSILGFSAYMYLLATVSTALATSYAYVNPVVALFLGAAMRSEVLTVREMVASAIIIFSVLILTLEPKRISGARAY